MAASNNNTEELLNYYVDRELTSAEEEELFARLAENDELRAELKQMQTIHSETRNFLAAMTPPAALTAGVFMKLGFSGSTSSAAAAQAAREAASTSAPASTAPLSNLALIQNLWLPISAAVVSAAITTIALFVILATSNKPLNIISDPEQPATIQTEQTQPPQPSLATDTASTTGNEQQARSGLALPDNKGAFTAPISGGNGTDAGQAVLETRSMPPNIDRKPAPTMRGSEQVSSGRTSGNQTEREPAKSGRLTPAAPVTALTAPPADISLRVEQREQSDRIAAATEKPAPAFPSGSNDASGTNRATERPAMIAQDKQTPPAAAGASTPSIVVTTLPPFRMPIAVLQGVPVSDIPASKPGEQLYLPFDEHIEPSPWALSIRYINPVFARDYSTRANQPSRRTDFYNIAAAVQYALSDNHYLYIEAGQEAFAQNYNGRIWIDHPVRGEESEKLFIDTNIHQNTMMSWATMNYMYRMDRLFGNDAIQPYFALGAGWSLQYGWFLNRMNIGVLIPVSNGIGMNLGAEHSLLLYNYDNTSFATKKLGFTAGLNYQF